MPSLKLNPTDKVTSEDNWFSIEDPNKPGFSKAFPARPANLPYGCKGAFLSDVGIQASIDQNSNYGIFTGTQSQGVNNDLAGCIGIQSYAINNPENTGTPPNNDATSRVWNLYIETKRNNTQWAGFTACVESEITNLGPTFKMSPVGDQPGIDGRTINMGLATGGGDNYGWSGAVTQPASVALLIDTNPDGRANLAQTNAKSSVQYTGAVFPASSEFVCNIQIVNGFATISNINPTYDENGAEVGSNRPYKGEVIILAAGGNFDPTTIISEPIDIGGGSWTCYTSPSSQNFSNQPAVVAHSTRYLSGIIFGREAIDANTNEAIALFSGHKINWYSSTNQTPSAYVKSEQDRLFGGMKMSFSAKNGFDIEYGFTIDSEQTAVLPFNDKSLSLGSSTLKWGDLWSGSIIIPTTKEGGDIDANGKPLYNGYTGEIRFATGSTRNRLYICVKGGKNPDDPPSVWGRINITV